MKFRRFASIEICCCLLLVAFSKAHHTGERLSDASDQADHDARFRDIVFDPTKRNRPKIFSSKTNFEWDQQPSLGLGSDVEEVEEEEPPSLPESSGAYAAWTQCDTTDYCARWEDYDSSMDCAGDDNNCPGDSKCLIECTSVPYMCFDPTKPLGEQCYDYACNSQFMDCPNGEECVPAYSDECAPRVCKDKSIDDDIEACIAGSTCYEASDCDEYGSGLSCVKWSGNCGIQ